VLHRGGPSQKSLGGSLVFFFRFKIGACRETHVPRACQLTGSNWVSRKDAGAWNGPQSGGYEKRRTEGDGGQQSMGEKMKVGSSEELQQQSCFIVYADCNESA